jgi:hypothetical protein
MIARVFYNEATDAAGRHVGFDDGYQPGHQLRQVATFEGMRGNVGRVSDSAAHDARDIAAQLVAAMNRGSGREWPGLDAHGLRSMSVGDVVLVTYEVDEPGRGWAYSCEPHGWAAQLPKRVLLDAGQVPV